MKNRDKINAYKRALYHKHKDEHKEERKEYYLKNKVRLRIAKYNWVKKNKAKTEEYRKKYKADAKGFWYANAKPQASKIAEDIILNEVLSKLGFTDQFKPIANFYFDSLAKKNGQICAIEVTTVWQRTMDKMHIQTLDYLQFPLYLFFVKPDLTSFFLAERQPLSKRTSFSYRQAKEYVIGRDV